MSRKLPDLRFALGASVLFWAVVLLLIRGLS